MVSWGIAKIKGIFPRHMCLYRDAFLLVFLVPYNFHAVSMDVHSVGAVLLNYSKLHVRYLPFDTTVFGSWKELCAPMPECVIYIQSVTTREENARKGKKTAVLAIDRYDGPRIHQVAQSQYYDVRMIGYGGSNDI